VTRRLVVESCRVPLLVQDLGRPGHAHLGVSDSGAADRDALRLANRLVGNPEGVAGLEALASPFVLLAHDALTVAVVGAVAAIEAAGRSAAPRAPLHLPAGSRLVVRPSSTGLRITVAVRGGIDVPPVLGSRSRDTLAALGPAPLGPGDIVPIGPPSAEFPVVDVAPPPSADPVEVPVRLGPRDDWFTTAAIRRLLTHRWTVSAVADRVGVRLDGPALHRRAGQGGVELPSEGVVRGALQVPADGRPVVLGPDHPTTGGYPVVAVALDERVDAIFQRVPGEPVMFVRAGAGSTDREPESNRMVES
jgi:biotin-dependent carboxylase-like uncharacterized protein